jgi:hypothetical protein
MPRIEYDPDLVQGFNFKRDVQAVLGHVTVLKIGADKNLSADMKVKKPTDMKEVDVVGVVGKIGWEGGHGDAIELECAVSITNKQTVALLLHQDLNNTNLELCFTLYDYDPKAKKFFETFHCNGTTLKGLIKKDGSNLKLEINAKENTEISSPSNYTMTVHVMPAPLQQDLHYATADQKNVVKKWGISVA